MNSDLFYVLRIFRICIWHQVPGMQKRMVTKLGREMCFEGICAAWTWFAVLGRCHGQSFLGNDHCNLVWSGVDVQIAAGSSREGNACPTSSAMIVAENVWQTLATMNSDLFYVLRIFRICIWHQVPGMQKRMVTKLGREMCFEGICAAWTCNLLCWAVATASLFLATTIATLFEAVLMFNLPPDHFGSLSHIIELIESAHNTLEAADYGIRHTHSWQMLC